MDRNVVVVVGLLSQTSPILRSPDGDNNIGHHDDLKIMNWINSTFSGGKRREWHVYRNRSLIALLSYFNLKGNAAARKTSKEQNRVK